MKKISFNLLVAFISTIFTNAAVAQSKPLACQTDAIAGLSWERGRWVTSSFVNRKFILVQIGNTLTTDSVAKVFNSFPEQVNCRKIDPQIACSDVSGGNMYFDPRTLTGGISRLFGATNSGDSRDTLSVGVFNCTPF